MFYLFTANTSLQKISPPCYRKPSYKTIVINKCACFHVVGGWLESFLLTSESVEDTGASLFLKLEPQRRFCIAYKKEEKKRRRWMWLSGQVGSRLNFETKLSLHDDGNDDDDCGTMVTERVDWLIDWNGMECGNDTFYGGGKLKKTPWAGLRIATNWTHDIMNSRTENQTCTIVKVVSRDIAKPQLLAQFSG